MKVYIGPYHHWFQPYSWVKRLVRWWYGYKNIDRLASPQYEAIEARVRRWFRGLRWLEGWIDVRHTRKIRVRIDPYDTWSVDSTLTLIVLPLLKQLKETKHGSAMVDDDDVPEELKSTSAEPLTDEQINMGYVDNNTHKRWDWVLGEMIWAFEQLADDEAESQFHSEADPAKPSTEPGLEFSESMRRRKFDVEGYKVWQARKTRGFTLFGKYFEALWD